MLVCELTVLLLFDLWDWVVVIEALHSSNTKTPTTQKNYANEDRVNELRKTAASTSNVNLRKKGNQNVDQLSNLDQVATNENPSQCKTAVHF